MYRWKDRLTLGVSRLREAEVNVGLVVRRARGGEEIGSAPWLAKVTQPLGLDEEDSCFTYGGSPRERGAICAEDPETGRRGAG